MAKEVSGPVETGAPMDYPEHEKTYNWFVNGAKNGSIVIASLLIAMAAGFFGHAGIIGSILVFIILSVGGVILAR